jgi:dihydrofolate reductase
MRTVAITRHAAVQGRGHRLFPAGWERRLRLRDSTAFSNGVVLLAYAPT